MGAECVQACQGADRGASVQRWEWASLPYTVLVLSLDTT